MRSVDLKAREVVISSREDAARLGSSPVRLMRLHGPIRLRIPGIEAPERDRLEMQLNKLVGVCGCAEGSIAGAITLIAIILTWVRRDFVFSFQSFFLAGALVIGAALLSKGLRVIVARFQLRLVFEQLLLTGSQEYRFQRPGA